MPNNGRALNKSYAEPYEEVLKKDNYKQCYIKLFEKFKQANFTAMANASGNIYDKSANKIIFKFFGKEHSISCDTGEIYPNASRDALLIITHLLRYETYSGSKQTGKLISLKEAKGGGSLFYPAFKEMAIDPLSAAFGDDAKSIYKAAQILGGVKTDLGHAAVTLWAFSKVPVTLVVWEGDEEIPASSTILYDESVSDYAHIEDVISIGITAAEKVINVCGK